MPPSQLEFVGSPLRLESLPFDVIQKSPAAATITRLVLLLPALLLVLVPAVTLVLGSSPALAYASAHPGEATLAAGGMALLLLLFGLPFARALRSLGTCRRLRVDAGTVWVTDTSLWRSVEWKVPLSSFAGVTHLVRTTLSGTRHEIVLIHPVRAYSVLVRAADRLCEGEVVSVARLLRLPLLPARDLLRWKFRPVRPEPIVSQEVARAA